MRLDARLAILPLLALLGACRGGTSHDPPIVPFRGMHEMPRYDSQERVSYFEDGRSMRPVVDGTLPREAEADVAIDTGRDPNGDYVLEVPRAVVQRAGGLEALMRRGHRQFDIYCAPCHSETGHGDGMVSQRATSIGAVFHAANLMDPTYQHMPDGRLFGTISDGVRSMPAYRAQMHAQDRWAVVAYVRALQISQGDAAASTADTDGDGLPAGVDECPEEAGPASNFGCPEAAAAGAAAAETEGAAGAEGASDEDAHASLTNSTEQVRG